MKKLLSAISLFSLIVGTSCSTICCSVQPKSTKVQILAKNTESGDATAENIDYYRTSSNDMSLRKIAENILEILTFTNDKYTNPTQEQNFKEVVGNKVLENWSFESIDKRLKDGDSGVTSFKLDEKEWHNFFDQFNSPKNIDNSFTKFTYDFSNNASDYEANNGLNFYKIKDKNSKKEGNIVEGDCEDAVNYDDAKKNITPNSNSNDKWSNISESFKKIKIIGKQPLNKNKLSPKLEPTNNRNKNISLDESENTVYVTGEKDKTNIDSSILYYRKNKITFSLEFDSKNLNMIYDLKFSVNNFLQLFMANVIDNYLIFTPYQYSFKKADSDSDFMNKSNLYENFDIAGLSLTSHEYKK